MFQRTPEANRFIVNPEMLTFHPDMVAFLKQNLDLPWISEKRTFFSDSSPYPKTGTDSCNTAVVPFWMTGESPGEYEQNIVRLMEVGNALKHVEEGYSTRAKEVLYVIPYLEGRSSKITKVRPNVPMDEYDALTALMTGDGQQRLVPGETVYAEMVASAIGQTGKADKATVLDPHDAFVHRYLKKYISEVLTLTAVPLFADWLLQQNLIDENTVVGSPDFGALSRCGHLAELLHVPLVLLDKWHPRHNDAQVSLRYGDVRGKRVIGFDEVIDTGMTITTGADVLHDAGAKEVIVLSTAGKFSGPAISRLDKALTQGTISRVAVTDSLPSAAKGKMLGNMGFDIISVGPLLVSGVKTLLEPGSLESDKYDIKRYLFRDQTPQEAYLALKERFNLPDLHSAVNT